MLFFQGSLLCLQEIIKAPTSILPRIGGALSASRVPKTEHLQVECVVNMINMRNEWMKCCQSLKLLYCILIQGHVLSYQGDDRRVCLHKRLDGEPSCTPQASKVNHDFWLRACSAVWMAGLFRETSCEFRKPMPLRGNVIWAIPTAPRLQQGQDASDPMHSLTLETDRRFQFADVPI